jgi:hypothetical protein
MRFRRYFDWYELLTPWFLIRIADPSGAVLINENALFSGIEIYYKRNRNQQEGECHWLRFWRYTASLITRRELEG